MSDRAWPSLTLRNPADETPQSPRYGPQRVAALRLVVRFREQWSPRRFRGPIFIGLGSSILLACANGTTTHLPAGGSAETSARIVVGRNRNIAGSAVSAKTPLTR